MAPLHRIITQLLFVVCAVAITSAALAKVPPKAQEHMDAGLAYVDDPTGPRYEDAYREFHAAYEIYPAYQLLANIGTCALYLERDAEAIDTYEQYLEKAAGKDIPANKRALMEKDIKTLKASLVRLNVTITPARVTLIDERFTSRGDSIVNRYEVTDGKVTLGIHPGNHRITAHEEGFEDQHWEVDAKPATTHSHEFRLVAKEAAQPSTPVTEPEPSASKRRPAEAESEARVEHDGHGRSSHRPTPASVYVGLGVTGIFAVASGVGAFFALSKRSDYIEANDGTHIDEASSLRKDMNRYLIATGIGAGAAVVSAGVTTYLYVSRPDEEEPASKQAAWTVTPVFWTDRAGLSATVRF